MTMFVWDYYEPRSYEFKDEGDAFKAEIPIVGANKEEIKVNTHNGSLVVSFDGNNFTPAFTKKWTLVDGMSAKDVTAKYENGVLTLVAQKPKGYEQEIKVE